jgi:hypothetical protein
MLRQVVLSANRLTSYAYARHAVADCPKGQFRDPTPPRGRGAYGAVANGDAHAAPERVNDFETPFVMRLASKRV